MAKATIKQTIEEVKLTLTGEEARTLYIILNFIGGSTNSLRKHTDSILSSLEEIRIKADIDEDKLFRQDYSCLHFKDYTLNIVGDDE